MLGYQTSYSFYLSNFLQLTCLIQRDNHHLIEVSPDSQIDHDDTEYAGFKFDQSKLEDIFLQMSTDEINEIRKSKSSAADDEEMKYKRKIVDQLVRSVTGKRKN